MSLRVSPCRGIATAVIVCAISGCGEPFGVLIEAGNAENWSSPASAEIPAPGLILEGLLATDGFALPRLRLNIGDEGVGAATLYYKYDFIGVWFALAGLPGDEYYLWPVGELGVGLGLTADGDGFFYSMWTLGLAYMYDKDSQDFVYVTFGRNHLTMSDDPGYTSWIIGGSFGF